MAVLHVPLRFAGLAFGFSGLAWAVATPFHPNIFGVDVARVVRDAAGWQLIHLLVMAGSIAAIFGAAGVVAVHGRRLGPAGDAALALTVVGASMTVGIMFAEAFAFPVLAERAPELLELDGPLMGTVPVRLALALAGGWPIGLVILGVLAARSDLAPRAGRWLAATTVGFVVLGGPFVPVLGLVATLASAAVHVWWSRILWSAARPTRSFVGPGGRDVELRSSPPGALPLARWQAAGLRGRHPPRRPHRRRG